MLNRPSSRRKSNQDGIVLNLVPILDAMVTLVAFLLFTMSFITIVSIESPVPMVSRRNVEEKLQEKPLQLTLTLSQNEAEIWSPFDRIAPKKIPNVSAGQPDTKAIHDALLGIKQQFPLETKIVLAPYGGASYDNLVATMDTVRDIDPTDPPIYTKDPKSGNDLLVKQLFPDVIFGNILGDTEGGAAAGG